MIELNHNKLVFRFPEVHEDAICVIDFQRTLRIPDDNREYPLPPGLGSFPIEHVEDHSSRLPATWKEHGGVLLPMYQAEAMWINFPKCRNSWRPIPYPFAVKIAAGKINAVTGEIWNNGLVEDPQDYLVVPDQPWLDGFCIQEGLVRQFVAMPIGQGFTAEEQISDSTEFGGIQILVYPMKRERYMNLLRQRFEELKFDFEQPREDDILGLAPGGLMQQEIYEDEYGYDAWDTTSFSRCYVHILNSSQWTVATGKEVPQEPRTAADYSDAGLPWFEHYDDRLAALGGAKKLAGMDSVAAKGVKLGQSPLPENDPVTPKKVVKLGPGVNKVHDGKW